MDGRRTVHRVPAALWQRLFVAGVDDGCDNFTLVVAMRIVGRFERASVERALECLIDRQEALRTTLHRTSEESLEQVVWDSVPCSIDDCDLRVSPGALQERLREYADEWTPVFDVPLLSARIFMLGDAEHAVAIRVHHAIADGWSCAILESEFRALYLAFAAGREPALEPLTMQHRHVRELETAPVTPADEAYWSTRPAHRSAPSIELARVPFLDRRPWLFKAIPMLEASRMDALAEIASTARVSNATAALAAVAASFLVHGQEQVRVAVVHANRYRPELRAVVGNFADVLPVNVDLTGDPTYRELVVRIQRVWLTTLAHRIPLMQISRIDGRDLLKGDTVDCDFEFNYLAPVHGGAERAAPEDIGDDVHFEPLDVPFTERRIVTTRCSTVAPWMIYLAEMDVLHGTIGVQEETVATSAVVARGAALVDTLARVVEQPDRPLCQLLGR